MRYPQLGKPRRPGSVQRRLPPPFTPPVPPTPSRIAVTREYPPAKVALRINSRRGQKARWAEDEPKAENVLADIEIGTEMPGGYKDLQGTLGRNPQLNWHDLVEFSDAYAYMPGVAKIWEGSLDKTPDVSGDSMSINPAMLGYQAILEDNQAAQVGFIDGDLSKWGTPSLQRTKELNAINWQQVADVSTGFQDSGALLPGIFINFDSVSKIEGRSPGAEVTYYGEGADIGRVWFNQIGDASTPWQKLLIMSNADLTKAPDDFSPSYSGIAESLGQGPQATGSGRKYAAFSVFYTGTGAFAMSNHQMFTGVKVTGYTGIEPQGTFPEIGYTVKQMLPYLINNFAQPLTVDTDFVDDDNFLITQAWWGEPTPVADIMKEIIKYGLYDWFVYHGKRLDYRKPGSYGRFWKAYTAESNLNETGRDSQRLWRSIVVQYTDVDGSTRTVGPPGSGCNVESSYLEINDPDHPAVLAERTRKDILDMQGIGTPASAIEVGKRFLEEANLLNRSGSATLAGYVMDQYGIFWPAAVVKSGDWVSFVDASDRSYRKIVNTNYRHNEKSNEVDLDAPASGLEALLERLQAGLLSLGVS